MLSISVAIRIDVYGMVYVLALALLLIVPRGNRFFVLVWVGYLSVHGILLITQYGFLLGRPPGYCLTRSQPDGTYAGEYLSYIIAGSLYCHA